MLKRGHAGGYCASGVYWIVESGDTLWKISQATGIPLWKIVQANPQVEARNLRIGSRICIPK